ncbi:hypothetical protein [Gymnodinialimonas mytili]|uniref:hypothetical protein n=1 Tax=Gymnodinialimonas mytili TaxID=3126503 RepID=UPI0030EC7F87
MTPSNDSFIAQCNLFIERVKEQLRISAAQIKAAQEQIATSEERLVAGGRCWAALGEFR